MFDITYRHADQVLRSYQQHPLFIGDVSAAQDITWLKHNKIGVVMTVASGFNIVYDNSIVHIRYDLQDNKNENISLYFDECSKQIQRYLRTSGVLVHCGAGVSRSATIVIAYLIKYKGMTFLQALKYLKSKRPQVCPNLGFQLQLKNYEALNSYSKNLSQRKSVQKSDNRPVVFKRTGFNITTYNKSYYPDIHQNRSSHQSINEKNKFVNKQKQELEYICKMAQFRFGITNMSKWRLSIRHGKPLKKVFEL